MQHIGKRDSIKDWLCGFDENTSFVMKYMRYNSPEKCALFYEKGVYLTLCGMDELSIYSGAKPIEQLMKKPDKLYVNDVDITGDWHYDGLYVPDNLIVVCDLYHIYDFDKERVEIDVCGIYTNDEKFSEKYLKSIHNMIDIGYIFGFGECFYLRSANAATTMSLFNEFEFYKNKHGNAVGCTITVDDVDKRCSDTDTSRTFLFD